MDGPGASTPISIAASAICASIFTISMVSMGFFSFMGIGKSEILCRKCSSPALISRESSEDDTCCQPKIHTRESSLQKIGNNSDSESVSCWAKPPHNVLSSNTQRVVVLRLHPGEELKKSLQQFVDINKIQSGIILTCVGSVSCARLRLAGAMASNQEDNSGGYSPELSLMKKHEILSLVGTLTCNGSHLHLCLGDEDGNVVGGHLMGNAIINTTAEIAIMICDGLVFTREHDPKTGYGELTVRRDAGLLTTNQA